MGYRVKRPVMHLASGQSWRKGSTIGDKQLPPALIEKLLVEGAISKIVPLPAPEPKPTPKPARAPARRKRKPRTVKQADNGKVKEE